MRESETPVLEGEVLGRDAPDPEGRDVTPGWVSRNRAAIMRGRALAQTLSLATPPHLRLALTAAALGAEGLLLAEDWRRGTVDGRALRSRAGRFAVETAATFAASRLAPAILGRHRGRIEAVRAAVRRFDACRTG